MRTRGARCRCGRAGEAVRIIYILVGTMLLLAGIFVGGCTLFLFTHQFRSLAHLKGIFPIGLLATATFLSLGGVALLLYRPERSSSLGSEPSKLAIGVAILCGLAVIFLAAHLITVLFFLSGRPNLPLVAAEGLALVAAALYSGRVLGILRR